MDLQNIWIPFFIIQNFRKTKQNNIRILKKIVSFQDHFSSQLVLYCIIF